ncbi:septum site-determining protein MinC [Helicobacter winghamensis]|uniref:septum site-determining protein MinC n=1 Tax=Helicobacter winghamensis TaxID=157268 RepID=UPI0001A27B75|nr:septum site-determining protein MinC [Helicobacter winghamensis]EEO26426.1 putative septum site-determining protein MinC [Helicobacter winghamensis ATCC BAA-430]PKT75136.1 septum site-determining protein MinC [Helicobacter winghamensis]PKT75341.1 septum site-determining protein MinC [Helicobacter winghamensis]QOQ97671.1 septum site-determining protein MinC [Helicobacter winghamensis]
MVKTRQKNFRAFIFVEGEAQEIIAYIDKNLGLLQSLLLVFTFDLNHNYAELLEYLKQKQLRFVLANSIENLGLDTKAQDIGKLESKNVESKAESKKIESKTQANTLVLNRTIRSGEEIIAKGDLTIFGRINSGAHIQSGGNLQIFGTISGNVFCDGEYMILGEVSEGNVLFGGEIVDKELLKYPRNKVYRKNDSIVVEGL